MTEEIPRPTLKERAALYAWNVFKVTLCLADTIVFGWMIESGFSPGPTWACGILTAANLAAFLVYPLLVGTPRWYRDLRITDNRLRRIAGKPTGGFD